MKPIPPEPPPDRQIRDSIPWGIILLPVMVMIEILIICIATNH
jgi:hypothetical protein